MPRGICGICGWTVKLTLKRRISTHRSLRCPGSGTKPFLTLDDSPGGSDTATERSDHSEDLTTAGRTTGRGADQRILPYDAGRSSPRCLPTNGPRAAGGAGDRGRRR